MYEHLKITEFPSKISLLDWPLFSAVPLNDSSVTYATGRSHFDLFNRHLLRVCFANTTLEAQKSFSSYLVIYVI